MPGRAIFRRGWRLRPAGRMLTHPMRERPAHILPAIALSQFAGTSLWFAGNAVVDDLEQIVRMGPQAAGWLISAVQFGFIFGTLVFAFFAISDRFSSRWVFFGCAALGAVSNLGIYFFSEALVPMVASRFLTGFFLAGVYPVGMKIAAGWYREGLGRAIGYLVGALVLGTALPHLVKGLGQAVPWQTVVFSVSAVALAGGLLMLWVPDGPHLKNGARFSPGALRSIFSSAAFRASAFGYFGHMWELYALWTFVPFALAAHAALPGHMPLNVPLWSFAIIGAGSLGCIVGGVISQKSGSAKVAFAQLSASGVCCLISPFMLFLPTPLFLAFLLFWGVVVVGDSPQFSALNAATAPPERVGSALTIVNCIGFSITIFSIQLLSMLAAKVPPQWLFLPLAAGPLLGLYALRPLVREKADVRT